MLITALLSYDLWGAPQRIDDEGTYVAQAYAVQHFGQLTHYTYFYDHPPLGWIQIAGVTWLTGAFSWAPSAVDAGRVSMVVAFAASAVLLWVLARRVGMGLIASSAALLIYGLSPLAVQYHRTVYLDNVAVPWLLAAFVLALSPKHRLTAFAGSGLCFGIAVLSKETFLLLGPFLAWQLWRGSHASNRRYGIALAASLFALCGVGYVMLAAVKGELFPGPGHVSLLEGVTFQLADRTSSGNVFTAGSLAHQVVANWLQLDHVFPAAMVTAAVAGLAVRRIRPLAAGLAFLVVFMLRPGYLPVPYIIALLPLGALLVPAVVEAGVRWKVASALDGRVRGPQALRALLLRPLAGVLVLASLVAIAFAGPAWTGKLRGLVVPDLDQSMSQAQQWIDVNVPRDNRVVVDDSLWVDLYRDGFARNNVVWYYKLDTDPAVEAQAPNGWKDYDYVVSTNSVRTFPNAGGEVQTALRNSVVVARFGSGIQRVEVRRIEPGGVAAARQTATAQQQTMAAAGADLATNSSLTLADLAASQLRAGQVDPRVMSTLAYLAGEHKLTVSAFPVVRGEGGTTDVLRQVRIPSLDGRSLTTGSTAAATVVGFLKSQSPPYAPSAVRNDGDTVTVTYSTQTPAGLISG